MARTSVGRPSDRRDLIINHIRGQIVGGQLPPGGQLPTRAAIETHFSAGPATVQRALDSLARDGFIESRGCKGTFVKREPPHLTRYALVFPDRNTSRNRFWYSLRGEAEKILDSLEGRSLALYLGVDGHSDSEDYQRLLLDIERHRVAGIIFASVPFQLRGTPIVDQPGLARVAYASNALPHLPSVSVVEGDFQRRAAQFLAAKGRKKVAVLSAHVKDLRAKWEPHLHAAGLETRPYWIQRVGLQSAECAADSVRLLVQCRELPDALIIGDDNLVADATRALQESGIRIPEDLLVITHCNFPYPPPNHVPVTRLGFDSRHVLRACIESIDRQIKGLPIEPSTFTPAVFEDEIENQSIV